MPTATDVELRFIAAQYRRTARNLLWQDANASLVYEHRAAERIRQARRIERETNV